MKKAYSNSGFLIPDTSFFSHFTSIWLSLQAKPIKMRLFLLQNWQNLMKKTKKLKL